MPLCCDTCWPKSLDLLEVKPCWHLLVYLFYGLATAVNTFAALSLPFAPAPYTYVAEIQFNQDMFTGSLNGISVQNLTALRVSLATFC
jgi:hypothetical protein